VNPAFIVGGTTLTLPALSFIAFTYEYSDLTWRDMPAKFCDENNIIAHSTLYKAVHGLGKLLSESIEAQIIREKFLSSSIDCGNTQSHIWPAEKSLRPHTINREKAVRNMLTILLCSILVNIDFIHSFLHFLERFHQFFIKFDKPLIKLYAKQRRFIVNTS